MSIQQILLAGGGTFGSTATVAQSGSFYVVSSFSPRSPSFPKSPTDGPLTGSNTGTVSGADFSMQADGAYAGGALGAFTTVNIAVTGGGIRTYLASAATFNSGLLIWTWGTGASPVWTAAGNYQFYFT